MRQLKFSMGFSLVEMMVAVSIMAILASVAIPSFQSMIRNQRVKSAGFELFTSLMVARSEAIKRNADVTLTPVSAGDWQSGWQITAGATVLKNQAALVGVAVSDAPGTLTYTRTGRASAEASFQINIDPADASFIRCIKIELSGLPRTVKGACS